MPIASGSTSNLPNQISFTLPANLDLETLILSKESIPVHRRVTLNGKRTFETVLVKPQLLIKHIPYCYYLIDLIINQSLRNHDDVNGYVNLMKEQINKVIPNNTGILVISLLKYLNIINVNDSYSVGNFSKSYRIDKYYTGNGYKRITIDISTNTIYNNIYNINKDSHSPILPYVSSFLKRGMKVEVKTRLLKENRTNDMLQYPEYSYQRDQLLKLKMDYTQAFAYAEYQFAKKELTKKQYHKLIKQLKKIESGEIDFNLNNSVNRLFSCVANLKKEYRQFILDNDGCTMLEIDFKNSHIYHLIHLINLDITNGNFSSTNHSELIKEVELIKSLTVGGSDSDSNGLYEYVITRYHDEHGTKIGRCKGKEMVLQRFINGKYKNHNITKWINSIFPFIAEYIAFNNKVRKNSMAIRLMQSESKLLHNRIMKRVAIEIPKCVAYAIHDSVIVESDYFDKVSEIMSEESSKYFGFEPKFSSKDLENTPEEFHREYSSTILKEQIEIIQQELATKEHQTKLSVYDFWDEFESSVVA